VGRLNALAQRAYAASASAVTSPPRIRAGSVVAAITRSMSGTTGTFSQVYAEVEPSPAATVVARIIASADVGVVPKRADGFGNEAFSTKVLEFMACGVPVIVARTKVDDYYFRDTQVRFFTPGSDDDLAVQMRWAFEQRDERARIAAAGHDYAREQQWEKHEGAYFSIVDRLGSLATGEAPHLCV